MKRTLLALFAAGLLAANTGCSGFRTMMAHQCGCCPQNCDCCSQGDGDCDCDQYNGDDIGLGGGPYDPGKFGYRDCNDYGCRAGCNESCCQRHCDCVSCSGHCMPPTKWGERAAMQGPLPLEYSQGGCYHGPINQGPPTGAVSYPYYTTRGPRDFLAKNPGLIGP